MLLQKGKFFPQMKGRRVAVVGLGVSHQALAVKLAQAGALVTVRDRRPAGQLDAPTVQALQELGASFRLGEDYLEGLEEEIIFRTPGLKYHTPQLDDARRRGLAVTSELEVFFELCCCPIYGVTGSDGKTTTTTLIAEMLAATGKKVHLGGNIGAPLLPVVDEVSPEDVAVVELSSFQLMSMRRSPDVAVITNVEPNHLDVHKDMQEYIDAKRNILLHQNAFGRAVLNHHNPITRQLGQSGDVRGQLVEFSRYEPVQRGAFLREDGMLCLCWDGQVAELFDKGEIRIPGLHNVENYLTAISAVWGAVPPAVMRRTAQEFAGVEHRIEFVRQLDGVRWYNDAIATSPTRTIAGLRSFDQKIIIIAGGYDKKIPFEPLAPEIIEHVKVLILNGATAPKIEQVVVGHPDYRPGCPEIVHADTLQEAVAKARALARPGDVVSLCPACASFDAYPNFMAKGRHFKELVNALD